MFNRRTLIATAMMLAILGCGEADETSEVSSVEDDTVETEPTYHYVGGEVSGLLGDGLVLLLNDEYELPIMVDATFRFDEVLLPSGSSYEVVVLVQPKLPGQLCELESASGTVTDFDITDISITCRPRQYRVGGTLTGLRGEGLEIMLNGTWSLQPTSDGDITFRDVFLDEGTDFEVTLTSQPQSPSQTCSLTGGEGTISGGDVVDVRVTCQTNRYLGGGTVEGLVGSTG